MAFEFRALGSADLAKSRNRCIPLVSGSGVGLDLGALLPDGLAACARPGGGGSSLVLVRLGKEAQVGRSLSDWPALRPRLLVDAEEPK